MESLIKKLLREYLLVEDTIFDKRIDLKKWYEEEDNKINGANLSNKIKKFKKDSLYKLYQQKEKELLNKKNPYGHEGNIDASVIYHYTNGKNLMGIIKSDTIFTGSEGFVSFTTNGNLYKQGFTFWNKEKTDENVGIKMKFDLTAMKNDGLKFYNSTTVIAGEYELRTARGEDFENIHKYLKEIFIFKDKEKNFNDVIKFLDSKNIKYTIINNDNPIHYEKKIKKLISQNELSDEQYREAPDNLKLEYVKTLHSYGKNLSDGKYSLSPYGIKLIDIKWILSKGYIMSDEQYHDTPDDLKYEYLKKLSQKGWGFTDEQNSDYERFKNQN